MERDRRILTRWKVRVIIAWAFRSLAIITLLLYAAVLIWLVHIRPELHEELFSTFNVVIVGFFLFIVISGIGGLVSWTDPWDRLPRFRDFH